MTEESRQIAGRYELVELVGSGAMGMVWRGEDKILGRVVAVKELLMPLNQGEDKVAEAKNRAMREARIAARLQHPNAISVFNVVEYEDRPWLIMEYLPSRSLSVKLHDDGPLTVDEVIPIAVQLAGVLAAAHRAGVVHRDVKPGNVLLGDDGTVKVTDFGISRAMGDVTLTATGEISGTPAFLAPEVARGEDATFASDVFALGATLYMAVEGAPPFGTADNPIALLYRVSSGSITPPKQAGKLEPLLLKLLELKPVDRPTMAEVAAELSALDGGATPVVTVPEPPTLPETSPMKAAEPPAAEPVAAAATPQAPEAAPPADRRRRAMIFAGAGALIVVLAVILIVVLTRKHDQPNQAANTQSATTSAAAPPSPGSPSPRTSPAFAASSPEAMSAALQTYFSLIPGDLSQSWTMLSPGFRAARNQSFESYQDFWQNFSSASASDVKVTGDNTLSAQITYRRKNGSTTSEHHTYVMVQQDGLWRIDQESK
ncbi:serine/threonine-protein kinase [Amycolatopsis panacis]|uniref:non-specific serine/threonine protein kinase n=1 Tax=Amycolatopsis panacis TaxID=2340917 RepID=A0A419HYJ5_9PSEU|nr:serine/threonine-protein kinase [Amycolatopsis panacis]RJQ82197.1 serine/threonine protein kinase [Amycolatopsis panacis]